jgi:cysteinyl-tRNA synthetase
VTDTGIRIHSTLTKRKEPLVPGPDGLVRIYACGPTVYSRIHIGNARPFVVFSVLKRYLDRRGYRAVLVCNLTDVNDKIYDAGRREGISSVEAADKYSRAYVEDTDRLGLGRPTHEPTVTETMPQIIALIGDLVDRSLAYPAGGDVYFRVGRFPGYGKLSGRRLEDMRSEEPGEGKESPLDFALWKGRKPDEDAWWDSPWGPGRPGWHIECSAMAETLLGMEFEIHGGGIDLVFPHHENEIAQSEGARGRPFAKIWMHNEMLELAGEKMAKSVGNIAPLADVLDRWPRDTVIAYFLTSHYRSKLPFSDERLEEAGRRYARIRNTVRSLDAAIEAPGEGLDAGLGAALVEGHGRFFAALDDDFNTPEAWAALDGIVRAVNHALDGERPSAGQLREARRTLIELLDVFALAPGDEDAASAALPPDVQALVDERSAARAGRDFAASDRLRDDLAALGYEVRDTAEGQQVRRMP